MDAATISLIGEVNANASCVGVASPPPTTNAFAPRTVNPAERLDEADTAVTVVIDPGEAHGAPKSIDVDATPDASVVADDGENDEPDGPENDTAAPDTGDPPVSATDADTGVAPDAITTPSAEPTDVTESPD